MTCNYTQAGDGGEELHLPGEGAITFFTQPQANAPTPPSQLPKDSLSPEGDFFQFEQLLGKYRKLHDSAEPYLVVQEDIDLLHQFKDKTVYSIGTAQMVHIYRHQVCQMVCPAVRPLSAFHHTVSLD